MKIATELGTWAHNKGFGSWFRLSEPIIGYSGDPVSIVAVSAAVVCGKPETYLFACDESGDIEDWCELPGSQRGILDQYKVLADLGYEIVKKPAVSGKTNRRA